MITKSKILHISILLQNITNLNPNIKSEIINNFKYYVNDNNENSYSNVDNKIIINNDNNNNNNNNKSNNDFNKPYRTIKAFSQSTKK